MTVDYSIPNWIRPADTAAHYAQGLQIGARIGAEQAAQQFQQQQLFREQQRDEFERQLASQKQQIAIDQITRKQRAAAQYQSLVQGGMDPMQALQQVGPDLADPAELIAMQQKAKQQEQQMQWLRTKDAETRAYQQQMEARRQKHEEVQDKYTEARTAALQVPKAPKLSPVDRAEISSIFQRLNRFQKLHDALTPTPENSLERMKLNLEMTKLKNRAKAIQGTSTDTGEEPDTTGAEPSGEEESTDETMTAAPEPAATPAADQTPTIKRRKFQSGKFIDQ